ncbi:Lipopolysaccharide export system ATP-binding protein LptB [Chryseobacterium taklimakanense]|uniref:Lipopolysaccharide export system ATP-binding protein LptB n=1 Tax=Chryseobacterium taklimakanense TaxID=536441 RepID=A0A239X314_9FLAO|nr:ATP-binding cassette domain-containing protein [Chryseobacterium taklimakanense]SNV41141.1 Lipopolysaccharide export system ATP-binding protein LptB [Chryseobacterium taklimakanense]
MSELQIDSIRKSFGSKTILQDIYLSCKKGQVVGMLGRNGTGKSTIFKIAFGLMKAENSFVRIDKVMQNQFDRKRRLGYLPQNSFLPRNIEIKNLISLFCNTENSFVLENHPFVKPFLKSRPRELSGAEQRIIEILLLIFSENEFVMLDEPFHSLSPKVVEEIKKLLKEKKLEKGFIISDHLYQDVMEISDRIYLLSDTSLRQISNTDELKFYKYVR